ncbi:MAG: carbonate dehydratase [Rhodothermales bacterium]|nr:carbonate dehydratase [Rhodothermales bacterium]MCA0270268.1 carbonate dehydratase [Bacteroidota bacterium]
MASIDVLIAQNRVWAARHLDEDPEFFGRLVSQQNPDYLWIGCADSRVPATELSGLMPGEMFVHRNVANLVVHTDLNCLSVIQYAVHVLRVEHVIVCGHYGCGGVQAALERQRFGLIDNWLRNVQDVADRHAGALDALPTHADRLNRLCELNVLEQVVNVCQTTVMEEAWAQGFDVQVHGWVYGLRDGHVHPLNPPVRSADDLNALRQRLADGTAGADV